LTRIDKERFIVTVILTVFNRKKKLFRALNSLLSQSYNNYECIIIDDGSTDGIESLLFPFLKTNSNIKYIRHSNRNVDYSLNTGLRLANGRFITFLDSDDEYDNNHLLLRIDYMRKNRETDLIYTSVQLNGKVEDFFVPDAKNKNKLIHLYDCIVGATIFGKSEVFSCLNGFRNMYSYDSDFIKRASEKYIIDKVHLPTYIYYRDSKDSILTNLKKSENKKWR